VLVVSGSSQKAGQDLSASGTWIRAVTITGLEEAPASPLHLIDLLPAVHRRAEAGVSRLIWPPQATAILYVGQRVSVQRSRLRFQCFKHTLVPSQLSAELSTCLPW
jgi:hypothetical protein